MIIGIKNGMVMQRSKDEVCDIFFECDEKIESVECNSRFKAEFEPLGENRYRLYGIEPGGPYILKINDNTFTDIYVGDLWLLTGQSNMQGVGKKINIGHNNNPLIRAQYMDDNWGIANHPLHVLAKAKGYVHTVDFEPDTSPFTIRGVGPGLAFAEKMFDLTAVPQGIIPCAHGGTNLFEQWNPDIKEKGYAHSLYAATLKRYRENGSRVAGMFWYQGCSDVRENAYKDYSDNMIKLVKSFRSDLQNDLPFVQVQICRNSWGGDHLYDIMWSSIREQQRLLNEKIDNFDTINTISYELADCIHLSSGSQKVVGHDAAESMFCLKNGKLYNCIPGIKLDNIEIIEDTQKSSTIILTFNNVHGSLQPNARALGFDMSDNENHEQSNGVNNVYCDANRVIISSPFCPKDLNDRCLWFGFGTNPPCNITDSYGRSIPAFGPVKMKM